MAAGPTRASRLPLNDMRASLRRAARSRKVAASGRSVGAVAANPFVVVTGWNKLTHPVSATIADERRQAANGGHHRYEGILHRVAEHDHPLAQATSTP